MVPGGSQKVHPTPFLKCVEKEKKEPVCIFYKTDYVEKLSSKFLGPSGRRAQNYRCSLLFVLGASSRKVRRKRRTSLHCTTSLNYNVNYTERNTYNYNRAPL